MQTWKRAGAAAAAVAAWMWCGAIEASALPVTFSGLTHGELVNGVPGIGIAVSNPHGPDQAIVFDAGETGTADPDLQGPTWSGGNLPTSTVLGNMLIIAENLGDGNGDGFVDSPDDQAGGGTISLFFDSPVAGFGLDLVDIEETETGMLVFYDSGGVSHTATFASLVARDGAVFGNRTLNRIAPFTASDFGGDFVQVDVVLAGSGAIDNLVTPTVPEPGTALLLGAALVGGLALRRRA